MGKRIACVVFAIGCGSSSSSNPDGKLPNDGKLAVDAPHNSGTGDHDLGSCAIFPAATGSRDDYTYWNLDITNAPVDPNSAAFISSIGMNTKVHPDFGSDPTYGIPYITVPGTQGKVAVTFTGAPHESDPGPYPIPPNAPIESSSDGHVLVIDRDNCMLYETGNSIHNQNNTWSAYSGAVFDLKTGTPLRPDMWTSADASGGPVFPGLARYEEVTAGFVNHAFRFTVNTTSHTYIHPATHEAGSTSSATVPPMGLRLRLSGSACTTLLAGAGTHHPQSKVIIQALCTYGMILTDNGSDYYISGSTDTRWDDDDLSFLKTIPGSDFEAIATSP